MPIEKGNADTYFIYRALAIEWRKSMKNTGVRNKARLQRANRPRGASL